MKVLNKIVETYRFDTQSEVMEFQNEVIHCSEYEVTKFSWAHKTTKKEDYYFCSVEKTYYDTEYFEN